MLSKKIYIHDFFYEFYPFCYFFFGTALYLLVTGNEIYRAVLLSAFFGAGFIALLVRQKHRRFARKKVSPTDKKVWLPKLAYEIFPVLYMMSGIALLIKTNNLIVFTMSLILFAIGFYFTISRVMHRLFLDD
jgi:hypothetical protein